MPFLKAGFNARNRDTGIRAFTASTTARTGFKPAELRCFDCGDYFWLGVRKPSFLAWGENVVIGTYLKGYVESRGGWGLEKSPWPRAG